MHFSIPDTQEFNEVNGSTYIGYNVHINGTFYCIVRYKQLHNLHEQLKKLCGNNIPKFPPKKILPLTEAQLEERRTSLEKYIQTIGQDSNLLSSDILIGYLLFAQRETVCEHKELICLEVYISTASDCYPILVNVSPFDQADQVLIQAFNEMKLPIQYRQCFGLFLFRTATNNDDDHTNITHPNATTTKNTTRIVRKLLYFESPYMALKVQRDANKVLIRKSYWDSKLDLDLMSDPVTLNLLYMQTLCDIENDWIVATRETKAKLASFKATLAKRDYVECARNLKYYGYIQFLPCVCDFPKSDTKVLIAIGDQELNMRIVGPGQLVKEGCFKVTRMKCWRITAIQNKCNNTTAPSSHMNNTSVNTSTSSLELSFEYLMSKDKLQWITITSEQTILMSVCLQSLVDELLLSKKNGIVAKRINTELSPPPSTPVNSQSHHNWNYMKRDGSCELISTKNSHETIQNGRNNTVCTKKPGQFSIKRLQEKFSTVSFKSGREFIENHAFEEIGDDDL